MPDHTPVGAHRPLHCSSRDLMRLLGFSLSEAWRTLSLLVSLLPPGAQKSRLFIPTSNWSTAPFLTDHAQLRNRTLASKPPLHYRKYELLPLLFLKVFIQDTTLFSRNMIFSFISHCVGCLFIHLVVAFVVQMFQIHVLF